MRIATVLLIALSTSTGAGQEPTAVYGIEGPELLRAGIETVGPLEAESVCTLTHEGPEDSGVMGLEHQSGLRRWRITSATTDGTAAAGVGAPNGFENTLLSDPEASQRGCQGASGFVSAVVLSFLTPTTLPLNAASNIARFSVEATAPEEAGADRIFILDYQDGCVSSGGQPVENFVNFGVAVRRPASEPFNVLLKRTRDTCNAELNVGFSGFSISSPEPWDGILGAGPESGCTGEAVTQLGFDEIFANVVNQGVEIQGWSLSIALESEELSLVHATTDGTVGASLLDGGLRDMGF